VTLANRHTEDVEICQGHCVHPDKVADARAGLEPGPTYGRLAELFGALADPTRLKIVHSLLQQELCSCDIAASVGTSASATSQHLRILRSLRLVKSRRLGRLVYYSLDDAHISLLVQVGLTHLDDDNASINVTLPVSLAIGVEEG